MVDTISLGLIDEGFSTDGYRDLESGILDKVTADYEIAKLLPDLTQRELEVAYFLSEGWEIADISKELGLSTQRIGQIVRQIKDAYFKKQEDVVQFII